MNPAEIVVRDIERDRCNVVVQLLGEAIRQPREATAAHAERKVLPFNVAGRDVLFGIALYLLAALLLLRQPVNSGPALPLRDALRCRSLR
jgi:hypothetical protein